jgi:UDP-N-acetylmuramoyl-tripeptide--D-alanyl-D-alanine ligase
MKTENMPKSFERIYSRVCSYLLWRIYKLLGNDVGHRLRLKLARYWRPLLKKSVFIGITGSAGKTTTKELLWAVLSYRRRGIANLDNRNRIGELTKTILRVRPHHDFCVSELSAEGPSTLDEPLALLQPTIGIVTVVADDHWTAFGSRAATAKEKGKLVASLPGMGTAVLNADDDLVIGMAANCTATVISYGISANAELRAEDISADWPERLSLNVRWGAERVNVRTQLCGRHLLPSVLGAIGGGLASGMSLKECAKGMEGVAPFQGRMQPVTTADGVTFIRDDFKSPLWSIDSCFEFMKSARAKRKIIVIGMISDSGTGKKGAMYAKMAARARKIADITIFVGPWSSSVLKARNPGEEGALRVFSHVRDAAECINSITRNGDLVLLKGTNRHDHLIRIIMARAEGVACWRDDCNRHIFCDVCPDRNKPSGLPILMDSIAVSNGAPQVPPINGAAIGPDEQVIVGLGNPEVSYSGTPHNVGYEVVDRIAMSLGLTWDAWREAWVARGSTAEQRICLVKFRVSMNLVGIELKKFSQKMSFGPEQCILLHDDLALPIGSIRTRMSGGAGGHRGVASILEAFQADQFRRVKVGVGKPDTKLNRVEYVLAAFAAEDRAAIDTAILSAEAAALQLVTHKHAEGTRMNQAAQMNIGRV